MRSCNALSGARGANTFVDVCYRAVACHEIHGAGARLRPIGMYARIEPPQPLPISCNAEVFQKVCARIPGEPFAARRIAREVNQGRSKGIGVTCGDKYRSIIIAEDLFVRADSRRYHRQPVCHSLEDSHCHPFPVRWQNQDVRLGAKRLNLSLSDPARHDHTITNAKCKGIAAIHLDGPITG
jgi:hypothetical protein